MDHIAGVPFQRVQLIGMPPAQANLLIQCTAESLHQFSCLGQLVQFRGGCHIAIPLLRDRKGFRSSTKSCGIFCNYPTIAAKRFIVDRINLNMGIGLLDQCESVHCVPFLKATPHNGHCGLRRIFCPNRAV